MKVCDSYITLLFTITLKMMKKHEYLIDQIHSERNRGFGRLDAAVGVGMEIVSSIGLPLSLDSSSTNPAQPFLGRVIHFLLPWGPIFPRRFFPSGEKRIWRREGNFDNFGGEKINGDKKEARRTGRGAAIRLRTKLYAISHCVLHNLTISQAHCMLHITTLQRIAKNGQWTHSVINRG